MIDPIQSPQAQLQPCLPIECRQPAVVAVRSLASSAGVERSPRELLDPATALRHFEGDGETWRILLAQFRLRYRDLPQRLERERNLRPAAKVAELVRHVVGVASSLGLTELAWALTGVCESLVDSSGIQVTAALGELGRAHADSFAAIDGMLTVEVIRQARDLSRALSTHPKPAVENARGWEFAAQRRRFEQARPS